MLDGKMLRRLTGTPMRRIALAKSALAEAEPEPLMLANLMTKSLTASMRFACAGAACGAWVDDHADTGCFAGARLRHAGPAGVSSRRNFCMSRRRRQRSPHSPQFRHTSSSSP